MRPDSDHPRVFVCRVNSIKIVDDVNDVLAGNFYVPTLWAIF